MFYRIREATKFNASKDDIANSEKILRECIISIEEQYSTLKAINLNQYIRQYIGYKGPGGDRFLWVNGLCYIPDSQELPDWKREAIEIENGGDCYFHLESNLDRGHCENINVQGI